MECINCNKSVIRQIPKLNISPHLHPLRRKIDRFFYSFKLRFRRNEEVYDKVDYVDGIPVEDSALAVLRSAINPQIGRSIWYRNPWIAGFLSIIPGLGQVYKGELIKGAIFFVLWLATLAFALLRAGAAWGTIAWSTVLSVYAAAVLDAITYKIIDLSKEETILWNIGILVIIVLLFSYVILPYFRPTLIQEDNKLAPCFEPNDRILISKLPYVLGEPQAGDIVYYTIPVEKLNANRYSSYEGNRFRGGEVIERIIGMPGDKFVIKKMRFWRNNTLLPRDLYPLSLAGITQETESAFTVPADSYFVYLSAPFNVSIDAGKRLSGSMISKDKIQGKVVFRYSPSSRWIGF
jgi:signal peptidase I